MIVEARLASPDDVEDLLVLYRLLEQEMVELHAMWPLADGLEEPADEALSRLIRADGSIVVVGLLDRCPFGFMSASVEEMLPQAGGERLGAIRLVFVEQDAREVGIGEAMRDLVLAELRERGITKFDAHVLPGHRLVKNFFESGGFSARSIVMHHDDER